ncbi:MAG: glycopeptide resistance accessory protein VanW [Oscillospiraceae bacterium]|jgi:vancomycin resistance protein VanW|nr:glycopeptide resistance accessory protein VanW [Oscillospiraceae bacterium]
MREDYEVSRKLATQRFPFLMPLRQWQRKKSYYMKMRFDGNRYSSRQEPPFPYELAAARSLLINEHTGADIQYQYNKVHNLRLASEVVSRVVIYPGETFSLWWLARHADEREAYKDGLCVHNGRLVAVYGGGLCQLSNTLFWLFLHTPLTIVERHRHGVKEFPNPSTDDPCGVDATILEGWLDLRVRNDSCEAMQIELTMDDLYYYGRILVKRPPEKRYRIVNENLRYFEKDGKTYESVDVIRQTINAKTGAFLRQDALYTNETEIGYKLTRPL